MYNAWGRLRKFLCASQKVWTLLILLYVLFSKKVDRTVHFYYCITLPFIRTILKNRPLTFISTGLIHNRNLRVVTLGHPSGITFPFVWKILIFSTQKVCLLKTVLTGFWGKVLGILVLCLDHWVAETVRWIRKCKQLDIRMHLSSFLTTATLDNI